MSEAIPESRATPGTRSATLPSFQGFSPAAVDETAVRARQPAKPAAVSDPVSSASPTYVPEPASATVLRTPAPQRSPADPAVAATPPAAPALPAPATGRAPTSARVRRTRKARLRISRVDPWSVMKTALLFGIAGGIIFVVATYVVMSVVESTGVYQAINQVVGSMLTSPTDTTPFSIETYINTRRATGLAALIGAVDVVIFTALATVFSFLYNLSATMLGGLELTLAED